MNLKRLFQSFRDAGRGVKIVFQNEQNFRLQFFLSILIIFLMYFFPLSKSERIVVIMLIALVLILELLNSAVERLVDLFKPRLSWQVEMIKDIMAAAVLLASFGSLIIGLVIFWPYVIAFFSLPW